MSIRHPESDDRADVAASTPNARFRQQVDQRAGSSIEAHLNIDRRANTSAASIPIAMADAINEGVLRENDTVLLAGFGAGLTWGGVVLTF